MENSKNSGEQRARKAMHSARLMGALRRCGPVLVLWWVSEEE